MEHRRARRILAVLASLASVLLAGLTLAPAAQAAVNQITCLGSSTQTFSPALTSTPQPTAVTIATSYTGCLSLTSPQITSGTSFSSATSPEASCLTLLQSTPALPTTITWNTGETSTITQSTTVNIVAGQVIATSTGTVTAGKFVGADSVRVVTYLASVVQDSCLTNGLPSNTGPVTLNILL